MQDRPDKAALAAAIARFLNEELVPAVSDRALGFRVRIAANLARIIAAECAASDAHDAAELAGLVALLPEHAGASAASDAERNARIAALNATLAREIRAGNVDLAAATAHVKATLIAKLAVVNPRFSTAPEIE